MKQFLGLTKRDMLIFFKDKQSIVFSLLTSIIVLVLYLLFLKNTFIDSINSTLQQVPELNGLVPSDTIEMYVNLTLLVGIVGSAMITVPYNCLSTVVNDRERKVDYDILATPIKRWQIILSYFVSAAASAIILTSIILTVGLMILKIQGNLNLDIESIIKTYGIIIIGSISATAFFMNIVLFFKSSQASGAFSGILSAASGFVIGAFIPISQFSEGVQTFCNIFPASHATILLRNSLLDGTLDAFDKAIGGVDQGMCTEALRETFGFDAHLFGKTMEMRGMTVYLLLSILICLGLMIVTYSRTYKKNT